MCVSQAPRKRRGSRRRSRTRRSYPISPRRKKAEEDIRKLNENLEANIRRRTEQLEQANRGLESFSYSVSHDLNTPLRIIGGFARLLSHTTQGEQRHGFSEKQKDYLFHIQTGVEQMKTLIESLLTFSRITHQVPQLATVDMRALVQEVVNEYGPLPGKTAMRAEVHIGKLPSLPAGDPVLLKQVFVNLLSNAFKFTRTVRKPEYRDRRLPAGKRDRLLRAG